MTAEDLHDHHLPKLWKDSEVCVMECSGLPPSRCPRCKSKFTPAATEKAIEPAAPRPWYKDPILQFAVGFPLLAVICFAGYLLFERSKSQLRSASRLVEDRRR